MPNNYWLRKAEHDVRAAFPDADLLFELFDMGSSLGVRAKAKDYQRAVRLGSEDNWVEKVKALIAEVEAGAPHENSIGKNA